MALSGTFEANFDSFIKATTDSAEGLQRMEKQGKQTEATINASFDKMTAGATSATTATAKMGTASTNTFTTMAKELRTADQSMAAFGVSINPVINVLSEIGNVAGKSASQLGALGTAGAVMATAMGAWNIGRWVADLIGADEAVANFTSSLLGLGDVAGQVAGNNADVLARASARAGRSITDLTEAIEINQKAGYANAEQYNTSANRVAGWEKEISKAANSGDLAQIVADLESQNSTLEQLHQHYKISTDALQYLQREMKNTAAATREKEAADKAAATEAQAHADAVKRLQDQMFGTDAITKAQQYQEALGATQNLTRMTGEEQGRLNTILGEAIGAYTRMGQVAPQAMRDLYAATVAMPPVVNGLQGAWTQLGEQVKISADTQIAAIQQASADTAAYEAETRRLVDEWNQVKPPVDAATGAVDGQTAAVQRLSVQMQDLGRTNSTVMEQLVAGMQLMDAYRAAGVATGMQIATGGYTFAQQRAVGVLPTSAAAGASTLNVTVNNQDAQGIATKLVTEMRHQGVRF